MEHGRANYAFAEDVRDISCLNMMQEHPRSKYK